MIKELESLANFIGNTPLRKLRFQKGANLYVKLEYNNYSGSIKDRAAYNIILQGIRMGKINKGTRIIESTSGNFGIALAHICCYLNLEFVPVIDPNINSGYEHLLRLVVPRVIKVDKIDYTGGYLLTRIKAVEQLCYENENTFWTNQYENPENYLAYYDGLANEICRSFKKLDYVFVGVSSGGTITGVSKKLKEHFGSVKVIAVDVEGSVIFNEKPAKRHISGIGSSKKPPILKEALIDEVVHVSELEIIKGCHRLLSDQTIFAGGSSGAVYFAIDKYFSHHELAGGENVLFLCPDRGAAYMDTIYNQAWAMSNCASTTELVTA